MMNLNDLISESEKKYRKKLEMFFTLKWGDTLLWSHDLEHHRRVWYYAKEILEAEAGKTVIETKDSGTEKITRNGKIDIDKLIIACFLHDLGMSEDQGVRHGHISRELGISFLKDRGHDISEFNDLLDALEFHDNKEYKNDKYADNRLLKVLSAADDLDAFGYIGIYRFLEIYLARGIDISVLGNEIRKNAAGRFRNFETGYRHFYTFYNKHKKRYLILDKFFLDQRLNASIIADGRNMNDVSGEIIRLVSEMSCTRWNIDEIKFKCFQNEDCDLPVYSFLRGLQSELSGFLMTIN